MAQTPPTSQDEVLTYQQDNSSVQVMVGSAHWYGWLQTASTFTFQSGQGHFTARKERAGWLRSREMLLAITQNLPE